MQSSWYRGLWLFPMNKEFLQYRMSQSIFKDIDSLNKQAKTNNGQEKLPNWLNSRKKLPKDLIPEAEPVLFWPAL